MATSAPAHVLVQGFGPVSIPSFASLPQHACICCSCDTDLCGSCEYHFEEARDPYNGFTHCIAGPGMSEAGLFGTDPTASHEHPQHPFDPYRCWECFLGHDCTQYRLPDGDCELCWLANK